MPDGVRYVVSSFYILPPENTARLPVKTFDNFPEAMKYFLEMKKDIEHRMEREDPDMWFIEIIEEYVDDYGAGKTKMIKNFGTFK